MTVHVALIRLRGRSLNFRRNIEASSSRVLLFIVIELVGFNAGLILFANLWNSYSTLNCGNVFDSSKQDYNTILQYTASSTLQLEHYASRRPTTVHTLQPIDYGLYSDLTWIL